MWTQSWSPPRWKTRSNVLVKAMGPEAAPCPDSAVTETTVPERLGGLDPVAGSCTASAGLLEAPCTTSTGTSAREKWLADVPLKYRGLYRRAWEDQSRKSAIRAFCLECVGWSQVEVRTCTARVCPLFEFRERG